MQRDAGISNFEYGVLAQLRMADEATMRLSGLAQVCNSTRPRLPKVTDRFEARDWVAPARPGPSDSRHSRHRHVEFAPTRIATTLRRELEGG